MLEDGLLKNEGKLEEAAVSGEKDAPKGEIDEGGPTEGDDEPPTLKPRGGFANEKIDGRGLLAEGRRLVRNAGARMPAITVLWRLLAAASGLRKNDGRDGLALAGAEGGTMKA